MQSHQQRWLTDLLEGVPSIVFILFWRQSGDLETAGWLGSAAALGVFGLLIVLKARQHPVLIGVNFHILFATPVIVGLFRIGQSSIAEVMAEHAHAGVLVTVLLAGIVQTLVSERRFSGLEHVSDARQLRSSVFLLSVCAIGAAWALTTSGGSFVPVVATLTGLIVGRNFLQARLSDKNGTGATIIAGGICSTGSSADLAA